jgi:hypothetical protein
MISTILFSLIISLLNGECGLTNRQVELGFEALTGFPSRETCLIEKGLEVSDWPEWRATVESRFDPLEVWERKYSEAELPKITREAAEIERKLGILFNNLNDRQKTEDAIFKKFDKLRSELGKYGIDIKT